MSLDKSLTIWGLGFPNYKTKEVGVDGIKGSLPALKYAIIEWAKCLSIPSLVPIKRQRGSAPRCVTPDKLLYLSEL